MGENFLERFRKCLFCKFFKFNIVKSSLKLRALEADTRHEGNYIDLGTFSKSSLLPSSLAGRNEGALSFN